MRNRLFNLFLLTTINLSNKEIDITENNEIRKISKKKKKRGTWYQLGVGWASRDGVGKQSGRRSEQSAKQQQSVERGVIGCIWAAMCQISAATKEHGSSRGRKGIIAQF